MHETLFHPLHIICDPSLPRLPYCCSFKHDPYAWGCTAAGPLAAVAKVLLTSQGEPKNRGIGFDPSDLLFSTNLPGRKARSRWRTEQVPNNRRTRDKMIKWVVQSGKRHQVCTVHDKYKRRVVYISGWLFVEERGYNLDEGMQEKLKKIKDNSVLEEKE